MDNLNDLKEIWLTAKTDSLPTTDEMLRIVRKFRNEKLRKKIIMIIIASALAALMVGIMFIYRSTMITTRIGELLMIIACGVLVFTNSGSIKRFYDLQDCSNKDFILFLEKTRQNQLYYYKNTQVIGMLFSSAGLLLYIFEIVHKDVLMCLIAYSAVIIYMAVLWFIIRTRNFKKQSKKLDDMIIKAKAILKQL